MKSATLSRSIIRGFNSQQFCNPVLLFRRHVLRDEQGLIVYGMIEGTLTQQFLGQNNTLGKSLT